MESLRRTGSPRFGTQSKNGSKASRNIAAYFLRSYQNEPSHKATLIWLALRYGFIDKSILVVTEGFGPQKFHGRVVVLVNEHTASADEMVSAFAEENNLRQLSEEKIPGASSVAAHSKRALGTSSECPSPRI